MKRKGRRRETKNNTECVLGNVPETITFNNIFRNRYVQILILLTIIGLILRIYNLGFNSVWLDEATTYGIAKGSFLEIWQVTAGGEFNPPLFNWLEHIVLLFGNNEFLLRLIPAVFGILTIPVMYLVGTEFLDRNVGIIAAALMAVSPFHIFYSQDARAYTTMLFFVTVALLFYLKALKTNDTRTWIIFGICSSLAFWSHFYSFVIIAALVLYAIIKNVRSLIPLAAGVGAFILTCSPLILVTIQLFISRTSSAPTFGVQGLSMIGETLNQFSGFSPIQLLILVCLFALGCIALFLSDRDKTVFLISIFTFSFIISFILSFKMPMMPRYMIFLLPVYFTGIAASYKGIYRVIQSPAVVYGFMAFIMVINIPFLMGYYSGYSKDDWRGVSGIIQRTTNTGDLVALVPGYISQPFNYYYSNETDGTFEFKPYTAAELGAIDALKGHNAAYYIVTGDIYSADPGGGALEWLNGHTKPFRQDGGIAIFVSRAQA